MNYIYVFSQFPMTFVVQTTLHSIIAAIIVEWILIYWDIKNPLWYQSFISLVIILPPLTFYLYLLIDPDHYLYNTNYIYIFQSYHWIYLKIGNFYPFATLAILIFLFTTYLFFIQEILPIISHYLIYKKTQEPISADINFSTLKQVLSEINLKNNYQLKVINETDYVVYSHTGKINTIYISQGVIEKLNADHLKSIILHEIAHIERNKKNYLLFLYILRIISFFNPIILYEFRRLLQEEEKICDLIASKQISSKRTLADALYILFIKNRKKYIKASNFKEYSAYYNIRKRIKALRLKEENNNYFILLIITVLLIIVINYFIV